MDDEHTQRPTQPTRAGEVPIDAAAGGVVGATLTVLSGAEAGRLHFVGPDGCLLGRGSAADIVFADNTISRKHARLDLTDGVFTLLDLRSGNGTFVDDERIEDARALPAHCRIRLGGRIILELSVVDELGSHAVRKLGESLLVDPLTGTGNRLHLKQRLDEELSFALRHGQLFGLLLLDLDRFKLVNDEYGHLVGDAVLSEVGRVLRDILRSEDAVFRYGGEEFCVLVRGLDEQRLMLMAERVRRAIAALEIPVEGLAVQVTVSIGVAALKPDDEVTDETLLLRADLALYRAKAQGRNRIAFGRETERE